jgi:hypothetical protein
MKRKITQYFLALTLLALNTIDAQVLSNGVWTEVGDVDLSIVNSDADNGDGVADGALLVNGRSQVVGQGVTFTFDGTMTSGETLNVSTYTYNKNVSYVTFNVQLYNLTDNNVLATSSVGLSNASSPPVNTTFNYTAVATDVDDVLQVRYIRTDNGHTARDFIIDNLSINSNYLPLVNCTFSITPDIALVPSNASNEADINLMYSRYSNDYLGTSPPSASALSSAESAYANLNINVSGGGITGNTVAANFSNVSFLKTFAQELKFNPGNTSIAEKARNTVWLASKQFCDGSLPLDHQGYEFRKFGPTAILLKSVLNQQAIDLFEYYMFKRFNEYKHFWAPTYDHTHKQAKGAIDTDWIYNHVKIQMAYVNWFDTDQERLRYIKGFKRYVERFLTYSEGTLEGIKADGSGYHHTNAYNNYMYAYRSVADVLYYMRGTNFEINIDNYKIFRQAVYAQYIQANDAGEQALSTNGRNPHVRKNQLSQENLKRIAIAGGDILGLSTADPYLAGLYNRLYGVEPAFNYNTVAPNEEGFVQLPYAHTGVFRKSNWLAVNKGFSGYLWGAEIYVDRNRYGRYQSYGALEILYPGNKAANGYDVNTWDWNFNPGTTVIRLPWDKLHAERGRIDELQDKDFAGSLSFKNKNSEVFLENYGDYGVFAMDFKEKEGLGFGATHSSNNHNNSFTFKKSNFYFGDIIVCLASGINNDDATNPTITTLYQRLDNSGGVTVNGTSYNGSGESSFNGGSNNWVLSNYNTGFYVISGTDVKVKKEIQQTPNYTQVWPVNISGNNTDTYYVGYLDHGTNPNNQSYEYVIKPNTTTGDMQTLHSTIQGGNKPYTVHQQDANAHIVEHKADKIWGYAFFNATSGLSFDNIKAASASCLAMTQFNDASNELTLSVSNPDIGLADRFDENPAPTTTRTITLQGQWSLVAPVSGVQVLSATSTETVIEFSLVNGAAKEVVLNNASLSTTDFNKNQIKVYPNPTQKGFITISSKNGDVKTVSLVSIIGQKVEAIKFNNNKLDVSNVASGIYLLQLKLSSDNVVTKKLIINN